ncbi:hypothetical protein PSECIP111951_02635 [Pseudoalteromonas holothuriae]|uniref:N-acetyltransferase domain-containing protein n=1 Tax=Pseudoalteromonas holothuriae TaxID=2963714 RepID=A0A9W4W799_9GAMM|nr:MULTISPECIES: GNAT family N-acetyltransferase [unclassified Pseudoalteromonas]CAH9062154.1 hypothetical protein PSECIP111951_02635 [Pseudoalteromonas sp. CIP111951]CAH9065719.1 hypothetical protein PSECIP111854_03740 [Pseudoalteromonas sp. CIP111854]
MIPTLFESNRLTFRSAETYFNNMPKQIISYVGLLLTDNVLKTLPQNWQAASQTGSEEKWLVEQLNASLLITIECKKSLDIIGFIFIHPDNKNAQIGYLLGEPYWHKGYGSEALEALVQYYQKSGVIKVLHAGVSAEHFASIKLLEKVGFTRVEADCNNSNNVMYMLTISK